MSLNRFLKTLGPGILFASTAIGVSHLVQSTRAGATYGYGLLIAVILANVLKFPFFEYGSRFANVCKKSLIDGYADIGRWMLWLYALITFCSMFFVTAAVVTVTAGFMDNLFQISAWSPIPHLSVYLVLGFSALALWIGSYSLLDRMIKWIAATLLISTLAAFVIALGQTEAGQIDFQWPKSMFSDAHFPFLIALMGWMPTAVDLSSWNSLWTLERIKQSQYTPKLKETLFEFNLGYWISALLSICFLSLGAILIYNQGISMPEGSAAFAFQVIGLYTETIGPWSYLIIASAAFSIMLGTSLGVLDGYARAAERTFELLIQKGAPTEDKKTYRITLLLTSAVSCLVIYLFLGSPKGFKKLIDFATSLSFIIAPIIAIANYRLVTQSSFPKSGRPNILMHILSVLGILFLSVFAMMYLFYYL